MAASTTTGEGTGNNTVVPIKLEEGEEFHAFIVHSNKDFEFVETLANNLEGYGIKCYYYEKYAIPGQSILENICRHIEKSRRLIVVISKDFLESNWCKFEVEDGMNKAIRKGKKTIIPILYKGVKPEELPDYLKDTGTGETSRVFLEYPGPPEEQFYGSIIKAIEVDITHLSSVPAGNVAHGLAWSYFYGYLNLVLPGLKERVMKSKFWKRANSEILWKMTIICPEDCYCPGLLTDPDPRLKFNRDEYDYIDFKATRAGNINRDYKSSVYSIYDDTDKKTYYFLAELATPLLSIYEMAKGKLAGLSEEQKFHQMKLFYEKLREILLHSDECKDAFTLIYYKWSLHKDSAQARPAGFEPLSTVILRTIKHELEEEARRAATNS